MGRQGRKPTRKATGRFSLCLSWDGSRPKQRHVHSGKPMAAFQAISQDFAMRIGIDPISASRAT